jgi:hypothetical protein
MVPILNYALPAMGICRNFPRTLVFASMQQAGIGIQHIHTLQEIARLKDIIHHTTANTKTGQLYCTSLEYLILELGMGTNLHEINYKKYHYLAMNSLIKNTWEFINQHSITLFHDIVVPKNTTHNQPIMTVIYRLNYTPHKIEAINQCRL